MTPMPLSVNAGLPKNVAWPGHSVYTAPSRAPTSSWTCKAWAARHSPALTLAAGQTFCPYKGLCSYYDLAGAHRAAWSYQDAYTEVRRISGMISFEPDKVAAYLDGTRLRLEPGQAVVPHGVDRDLTTDEAGPGRPR